MKKILLTILILMVLTLSACNTSISAIQTGIATSSTSTDSLPIQTQLVVGIFELEGTEQTVTADQASELLPLWQVYQELLTSDTAAQEEIDGLVGQIQETMTAEQLSAIEAMGLTQQDVLVAMQEQDIVSVTGQSDTSNTNFDAPQGAPTGDMPVDAMPAGDMGIDLGQAAGPVETTTSQTPQTQTIEDTPTALIDALVQLLESKVV